MGLTTWKNAPHGKIRKADVSIAKNYLTEREIGELDRVVSMYLDYAEDQAAAPPPMHMADWVAKLDAFLRFNERNILTHAGKVSHELAEEHAHVEFDKYEENVAAWRPRQPTSDFDRAVEEVSGSRPRKGPSRKKKTPPSPKIPKTEEARSRRPMSADYSE